MALSRRARVVWWSFGGLAALAAVLLAVLVALLETGAGRERIRRLAMSRAATALGGRGTLFLGRLEGGLAGRLAVDSVALLDDRGRVVAAASRIEADGSLAGLLWGRVRLTRLVVVRPFLFLERKDSVWNVSRLFPPGPRGAAAGRSPFALVIDSTELREGRVALVTPDTLPTLPLVHRTLSGLEIALGPSLLAGAGPEGGVARIRRFAVRSSLPRVTVRETSGTVRWWPDSLALNLPLVRLPASRGSVRGTVAWAARGAARLDLRARADQVSLEDVAWLSALLPGHGSASGAVAIRGEVGSARGLTYAIRDLDVRATRSRITGAFDATVGRGVAVTDLALAADPLDLDLVRELFGDSVPKRVWRGALRGTVRGTGGPLDAIRLDDARLSFEDHRLGGARSRLALAGVVNARAPRSELRDFRVRVEELDVRTLGAVVRMADSLHGVLTGSLVLDGPVSDVRFHDLTLRHVDGDRPRSRVSGEGRLASDVTGRWLDATLALDSVAPAALARGRTSLPLTGAVLGTLELHATGDTMSIDAALRAGRGAARFRGLALLDSTRTWLRGSATLEAVDPRALIARRDIPALRLDGTARLEVEADARRTTGHLEVALDSTSVIGVSPVHRGRVRAGVDSTGVHVDTADLRTRDWRLAGHGRIARAGETHDTLWFAVTVDALASLSALLLDSAGAARADSVHGAAGAAGVLVGSLDTLALDADFSLAQARWNDLSVRLASGHATLARLPAAATGRVTLAADSVAFGGRAARHVEAGADLRGGRSGHGWAEISSGDSLRARVVAGVEQAGNTTRIALDSVAVLLGGVRWGLDRPARATLQPRLLVVDSTVLHSSLGATLALRATLPDSGAVDGRLGLSGVTPGEFAVTGFAPMELSARADADVRLSGTRDAPRLAFTLGVDSVSVRERAAPSLHFTGDYEQRRARVDLRGAFQGREILAVTGSVPVDLTLRAVTPRLTDDTLALRVRANEAALPGLEALVPGIEGLAGTISADLSVGGTLRRPAGRGTVRAEEVAFDLPRWGTAVRRAAAALRLSGDTVIVDALRMDDGDRHDTVSVRGAVWQRDSTWLVALTSEARDFRVMDDPRLATAEATWSLTASGGLRGPELDGTVSLERGTFVIGAERNVRPLRARRGADAVRDRAWRPFTRSLVVTLGNDVRLRSRDANVQLSGTIEAEGPLRRPYVSGEFSADRGTYRVDLGVLKRTFRVDSGTVWVEGTVREPAALDIWSSYVVRTAERDDVIIGARVTGTTDAPRLELRSSADGSTLAQSEIISYLIFGSPSFGLDGQGQSTVRTATAALVPSLGGVLEGVLGTLLPFFSSLQVTTVAGAGPQSLTTNPLDGLLSSYALTAGRQVGTDAFLSLSAGRCSGSRVSSTQSPSVWFGVAAEYRPKRTLGAAISVDPGSAPCNRVGRFSEVYQFGLDLFREWRR